jgi:rsbT co-antagonist protein RsbR
MSNDKPNESEALHEGQATGADLAAALEKLRRAEADLQHERAERAETEQRLQREVSERAEVEQELRGMLNIIRQQEEAIRAMATPILRLWDGVLTMPVVGRLDSIRATQMMESLLHEITRTRSRFTILDLTGAEDLDASAANHLLNLMRAAGLLGTRCLVSGISPKMAQTIIGLGLSLTQLATFSTLEEALHHAIQESAARQRSRAGGDERRR